MGKVIVKDVHHYEPGVIKKALNEILDSVSISFAGKSILLKPNMVGMFRPERGVTTHPLIVKSLIESLKQRGAKSITVGDNPGVGGYAISDKVAKVTGIGKAAGNHYKNIAAEGVQVKICDSRVLISKDVLEADIVINLPKFKTHTLTIITGAIKNTFGYIIGAEKARAHFRYKNPQEFSEFMADVCSIRPPELTIIDAVVGMEGNGPSGGPLRYIGKLIAGEDVVAVDSVVAGMMGLSPHSIPMIRKAQALGLGSIPENTEKVQSLPAFKLPVTVRSGGSIITRLVNSIGFYFISRRVPSLVKKYCTGCKICSEACPTGAIQMIDGYPEINYNECISCFCCHEQCPSEAWKIKMKLL